MSREAIKHTPGPWLTTESTEHWGRVNVTVQAAFTANEIATAWQGTTDVNRANARLIAAAPDLLEACELIVSAFDQLAPMSPARNEPLQINAARAAIAKARGEQ